METKHTPGPWKVEWQAADRANAGEPIEVLADDRNVCPLVGTIDSALTSPERAMADARLIAAAPELLDRLCDLANVTTAGRCQSCGCAVAAGYCGCAPGTHTDGDEESERRRSAALTLIWQLVGDADPA